MFRVTEPTPTSRTIWTGKFARSPAGDLDVAFANFSFSADFSGYYLRVPLYFP